MVYDVQDFLGQSQPTSVLNLILKSSSDFHEPTVPPSLAEMAGEGLCGEAQSWSQSCLRSLEQLVRLLGGCGPPVYLYFISLPPGGWDRTLVTRQTRSLNLAEVLITNHQDLLPSPHLSETLVSASQGFKVRSLSLLQPPV